MTSRSNGRGWGRSRERSPLRSQRPSTSYGAFNPGPGPDGPPSPPPYEITGNYSDGCQETHGSPRRRDSSLRLPKITAGHICGSVIFLIILAQAVAFIFFYDLPSKLDEYSKASARMREQQGAMRKEARHLEQEKGELREERKRWERARDDRVPQDAFWADLLPAGECLAYGKREYKAMLQNIPKDWTDLDACMNMPVEIKGITLRRPDRCEYVGSPPHIRGIWMVDWDQPDCKPWHLGITDTGCTNRGSGTRRLEAWVVGINDRPEQDWRLLCESTPMTWDHVTYNTPTHCDARAFGKKIAMWDIPDNTC